MNSINIPSLRIGDIEVKVPIIQGGMSVGISLSGLASAVANEGGIGVIGTAGIGMLEPDYIKNLKAANHRALRKEIRTARNKTNGIIGANIMLALSDFDELTLIALEEGVDLVFVGAGLPLRILKKFIPNKFKEYSNKIVPIVSSARATKILFQHWVNEHNFVPDAIVVEGPLAGGHLGFKPEQIKDPDFTLEKLLAEVISVKKPFEKQFNKHISVIVAGGIYSGSDIYKFLKLGANGVQMATRFVATHECDASIKFKETYVKSQRDDIIIIESPVGLPGRAIKNQFLEDVANGYRKPFTCPWKCLKSCEFKVAPYCIALALINAKKGIYEEGFSFAGANAYRIDKIISVKELIDSLLEEYKTEYLKSNKN